ncbi:MAG: hypothetical protein MUC50_05755 [Myxococcota bacterium]|jgi:hypothetical protein|nr:hypothetical protein [Myxococcota bacterium]
MRKLFDPSVFETDLDFYVKAAERRPSDKPVAPVCVLEQGMSFLDFLVAEDRKRVADHARAVLSGALVGPEKYSVQTEGEATIAIAIDIDPIFENGRPSGMRLTVTELTSRGPRLVPTPMRGIKPYQQG